MLFEEKTKSLVLPTQSTIPIFLFSNQDSNTYLGHRLSVSALTSDTSASRIEILPR
jgi:hypothetical protein